ncbi:MAG: DUF3108 domain-containing protein [Candidatus Cyclobacteriaceae bacterium M3_2C_046]
MQKKLPINKLAILVFIIWIFSAFTGSDPSSDLSRGRYAFIPGEKITFRVHYGFINAGEAVMTIDNAIHQVNRRPCYKIDLFGTSTGVFDLALRIRDNWGTYLDTSAFVPRRAYRNIEEGRYRKYEIVDFHHAQKQAIVTNLHKETKKVKKKEVFQIPANVQDMVSGYYFLRTIDFEKLQPGDTVNVNGFFENKVYSLNIRFLGKQQINTQIGKLNTLVCAPIMPNNKMFDGENSIRVWLSDDFYKVPVKVKAKMFVGAIEVDIKEYRRGNYVLD